MRDIRAFHIDPARFGVDEMPTERSLTRSRTTFQPKSDQNWTMSDDQIGIGIVIVTVGIEPIARPAHKGLNNWAITGPLKKTKSLVNRAI
jgi:hypothetical protein